MMTSIVIKESNRARIEKAIKEVEGRCTERLLTYDDMVLSLAGVERELGISKKAMTGVEVHVDVNAQTFPNAYRFTPHSTHFYAIKTASGWKLTGLGRDTVRPPTHMVRTTLTPEACKAILDSKRAFKARF